VLPGHDVAPGKLALVDVGGLVGVDVEARHLLAGVGAHDASEDTRLVRALLRPLSEGRVVPLPPLAFVAPGVGLAAIEHAHLERAQRKLQLDVQRHRPRRAPEFVGRPLADPSATLGCLPVHRYFPFPPLAVWVGLVDDAWVDLEPVAKLMGSRFALKSLLRPCPIREMPRPGRAEDLA
jgi:hypothetical protein